MNEQKLKQLFAAARKESAPSASPEFAAEVLRAVRRDPPAGQRAFSLLEHLDSLFPRLALAAAGVVALCLLADFGLTLAGMPDVGDGAAQAASQLVPNLEDL